MSPASSDVLAGKPLGEVVIGMVVPDYGGTGPGWGIGHVGQLVVVGEVEHQAVLEVSRCVHCE